MKYKQLTREERYQIYALKKKGCSIKSIATILMRCYSTIYRELRRNSGYHQYQPELAQEKALFRRYQAEKQKKITPEIALLIKRLLWQDFSPEQITGRLRLEKKINLHHESIYRLIYKDKNQSGNLWQHLRIAKKPYRKRYGKYEQRGRIKNRVSIDERPQCVDNKVRIGDWEGDTVIGKNKKSVLLTLVERKTLFTIIVKLNNKTAHETAKAAIRSLYKLKHRVKTITFDNGLEFAAHEQISKMLNTKIYFAHPYASWERGINENINGLIRQYFPKKTDFSCVSDNEIRFVMNKLNNRPRKTRGYKTPNELFLNKRSSFII